MCWRLVAVGLKNQKQKLPSAICHPSIINFQSSIFRNCILYTVYRFFNCKTVIL